MREKHCIKGGVLKCLGKWCLFLLNYVIAGWVQMSFQSNIHFNSLESSGKFFSHHVSQVWRTVDVLPAYKPEHLGFDWA